jgi:predicted anti-sigma-YlaC factor YlaD
MWVAAKLHKERRNLRAGPGDYRDMECARAHEVMSANLDGEANADERRHLMHHLAVCADCRTVANDLTALHRALRVTPAPEVPDLTPAILAATTPAPPEPRKLRLLRLVIAASSIALFVLALPELLAEHSMMNHGARHLGAIDIALAAGFAIVAWRPQRSLSGFLPIATVLVGVCLAVTFADHTANVHLATHAWSIVGLGAAWMLEAIALRGPVRRLRLAA